MRSSHVLFVIALVLLPHVVVGQEADPVAAGYQRLYGGQIEDAQAQFDRARRDRTGALAPWFGSLFAMMAQLEYDDDVADAFEREADAFIAEATARYERSAQDSEALFFLAQAHLLRGTFRFVEDKGMWGAARDGARSKSLAEEYIKRHPEHGDAYLALGLYNYFVDIAPTFVKFLRVILFLPSGNRAEGIRQLERVAANGSYFANFAQATLADIYGSFEGRPREAITLSQRYLQRFPDNQEMRLDLASLYMHPAIEDFSRAEAEFSRVRANVSGTSPRHVSQRHSAVLGLAALRRAQWRIDEAIELLNPSVADAPAKPEWLLPTLLLRRGNYKMLINDASGLDDVSRVQRDPQMKDFHDSARQLVTAYHARQRSKEGPVYIALLPGNRLVAEDKFDEARAAYAAVETRYPGDWQVRYRLAYLEFARGRHQEAAAAMSTIVTSSATMPDWLKSAAILHLAYTHDLAGRRQEALKLYQQIVDKYEDDGSAGAARIGLLTPYRGKA